MPELAEIYQMSELVNAVSEGHTFSEVYLSDVTAEAGKNPSIVIPKPWLDKAKGSNEVFRVWSTSRGKELQLHISTTAVPPMSEEMYTNSDSQPLQATEDVSDEKKKASKQTTSDPDRLVYVVRAGMSGHWMAFPSRDQVRKHAHLNFVRSDGVVLSFVDARRFGKWEQVEGLHSWGTVKRSPCPVREFEAFKEHLRQSLKLRVFEDNISDILLDQRYFNGVGNYLRAEILYRAGVSPFVSARKVLLQDTALFPSEDDRVKVEQTMADIKKSKSVSRRRSTGSVKADAKEVAVKAESQEVAEAADDAKEAAEEAAVSDSNNSGAAITGMSVVQLCHDVPREVIDYGFAYQKTAEDNHASFKEWLRCYGKLNCLKDKKGRMIWFGPENNGDSASAPTPELPPPPKTRPVIDLQRLPSFHFDADEVSNETQRSRKKSSVATDTPKKKSSKAGKSKTDAKDTPNKAGKRKSGSKSPSKGVEHKADELDEASPLKKRKSSAAKRSSSQKSRSTSKVKTEESNTTPLSSPKSLKSPKSPKSPKSGRKLKRERTIVRTDDDKEVADAVENTEADAETQEEPALKGRRTRSRKSSAKSK